MAPTDDIMFLPTENTKNTKFSLVNRFVFANGEHEEHEVFSQQIFLLPTDNTDNTKIFFGQQITLITQKINFVIFVSSVGKRKKSGSSGDKEKTS